MQELAVEVTVHVLAAIVLYIMYDAYVNRKK